MMFRAPGAEGSLRAATAEDSDENSGDSKRPRNADENAPRTRVLGDLGGDGDMCRPVEASLSEISLGDRCEVERASGSVGARHAYRRVSETQIDARSRDELDELRDAFDGTLARAELAKRISSADEVVKTVSDVRRMSERLRDLWSMNLDKSRDLARRMSSRCWNFAIEKTALETKTQDGGLAQAFVGPLLDLRYLSCELLDHAAGLTEGFTSSGISSLSTGMVNHLTLATLLHNAGEFKTSEEQFVVAESYVNAFKNAHGALDSDCALMAFEAQTVRAKNSFLLGDMVAARDFLHDAKVYAKCGTSRGNELMCMSTLVSAKINLAEDFNTTEKLSTAGDQAAFDKRVRFLIEELDAAYSDLFQIAPSSWSTEHHPDTDSTFVLTLESAPKIYSVVRSDGLYIRILHNLANLHIRARSYDQALQTLQKLKTIKSFVKASEDSDSVLVRDLHALTDSFLMDNMLIEAFSGLGEASKACGMLEELLADEKADLEILLQSCVKLGKSEKGAGAVASNVGALVKRMSGFPSKKRQEMLTNVLETLMDTAVSSDEATAANIVTHLERFLTDSNSFRDSGLTRDGQSRAYAVIWNAAADMYMENKYSIARTLFGMTLPLSSQSKSKSTNSSAIPVMRLQVMCDLENNDLERARESLQSLLADKSSKDVSTVLLSVKFQLVAGDLSGLADSISSLVESGEPDALLYVAGELDGTKHHEIAADAFRKLYDIILDSKSTERIQKEETFIFCSYLRHLKASLDGKFDAAKLTDCSYLFQEFMKRVSKHGIMTDFRQAQYLADFSWNIGLDAYEKSATEAAYTLMFCSAFIVSKLQKIPEGLDSMQQAEYRYRQTVALLLSIASLTSQYPVSEEGDESMRNERLASNISRSKSAMSQLRGLLKNTDDERYEVVQQISFVLEYEIACSQSDIASQNKLVDELAAKMNDDKNAITVLLLIADRGASMRTSDLVTISRAYEEVAAAIKRQSAPDAAIVGRLMRKRIQLASRVYKENDDAIHRLYDEAEELLTVHPSYPPVEAQWLLSTCFNRAVRHERSMRIKEAVSWLNQTQKLLTALENVLPEASEHYLSIVEDNLAVLTVELGSE